MPDQGPRSTRARRSSRYLSSELLVDNPWHSYRKDRFRQKDGSVGEYYYVDMHGACGTVPLFEDGSTVLVKVYRYLFGRSFWEFPIGGMKAGEDPQVVAARELREEAGLTAGEMVLLGRFAPYKGVSNEVCHFYLARDLAWTEQELEPSEEITVHQMELAGAREKILGQDLGDGQSIAGLMLLDRFMAVGG